jgi:alkylated DNA repair dioxygenase AlkB
VFHTREKKATITYENTLMKRKVNNSKDKKKKKTLIPLTSDGNSWLRVYDTLPSHLLFNEEKKTKLVDDLWSLCPLKESYVKIMGKDIPIPRYQQTYSDTVSHYRFSGVDHVAVKIPALLTPFMEFANSLCVDEEEGERMKFNVCFVNWYRNGEDYIGYHSDKEKQLFQDEDGNINVLSMSFGEERRFLLKPNDKEKGDKHEMILTHGSTILMGGQCQSTHKHSVPKVTKTEIKNEKGKGRRVNLTFRRFK